MTLQSSTIFIDQLHLYAFHGVMEQERRVGAEYTVFARVHYNINEALNSDDVADTLNYAELCAIVKEQMAQPSKLLEHVAGRICKAIFDRFPQATAVDLKLTKLNPPMGVDCSGAGVEVYFTND
ncbi:MAG: dihydroneopterin aldolase [Prevotella sp.]|nr:dihydroneopterin aldolase [Prevotella sp.]